MLRKSASHDAYLCNQKLESDDLAATLVMQDALEMLYNAVKNLPDELQHLFRLHIEDGLRLREVAEQLNLADLRIAHIFTDCTHSGISTGAIPSCWRAPIILKFHQEKLGVARKNIEKFAYICIHNQTAGR